MFIAGGDSCLVLNLAVTNMNVTNNLVIPSKDCNLNIFLNGRPTKLDSLPTG